MDDFALHTIKSLNNKMKAKIFGYQQIPEKYASRLVVSNNSFNESLAGLIHSGKPFMVCRYGYVELSVAVAVDRLKNTGRGAMLEKELRKGDICNNAGFFPNELELIKRFGYLMMTTSSKADYIAAWNIPYEEYMIKKYASQAQLCRLRGLEPWYAINPWTLALEGKKVLVIHPFDNTISTQYKKREQLFPERNILPEFELLTFRAVQTIAGNTDPRFSNWFDALNYMFDKISKIEFDVAILGCGAYGFPLAAMIKDLGKQAIHMGGATQLLFGIKGKRWDNHPVVSKLYNDAWVRPSETEKPHGAGKVEKGCYW